MTTTQRYGTLKRLYQVNGDLAYTLAVFGDHLAEREGYKAHRDIDAIHFYLINKHHWLPSLVRSMSFDDLSFLMSEEQAGWTLPKEALF